MVKKYNYATGKYEYTTDPFWMAVTKGINIDRQNLPRRKGDRLSYALGGPDDPDNPDLTPLDLATMYANNPTYGGNRYIDTTMLRDIDNYMISKNVGLPQRQAIAYTVQQEGNTTKSHGNGATGLVGWRGDRAKGLGTTTKAQAAKLYTELYGTFNADNWNHGGKGSGYKSGKAAQQAFQNAKTAKDATHAMNYGYVRPPQEDRRKRTNNVGAMFTKKKKLGGGIRDKAEDGKGLTTNIPPHLPQGYYPTTSSIQQSAKLYSNDADAREKAVTNLINRANKKAEAKKVVERFDPEIVEQNNIDGLNTWAALAGLRGADFVFNPWVNQGIKAAAKPILGGAKKIASTYVTPVMNELGQGLSRGLKTELSEGINETLTSVGKGLSNIINKQVFLPYRTKPISLSESLPSKIQYIPYTLKKNLNLEDKLKTLIYPEYENPHKIVGNKIYFEDAIIPDKASTDINFGPNGDINHLLYRNMSPKEAVAEATKDLTSVKRGKSVRLNYDAALSTDSYPLLLNIMKSNTSIMPKGRKFKVTPTTRFGKQKMMTLNSLGRATDPKQYILKDANGLPYMDIVGRPFTYGDEHGIHEIERIYGPEEARRVRYAYLRERDNNLASAISRINKKIDDLNKDRGLSLPHAEIRDHKLWVPAVQAKRIKKLGGSMNS